MRLAPTIMLAGALALLWSAHSDAQTLREREMRRERVMKELSGPKYRDHGNDLSIQRGNEGLRDRLLLDRGGSGLRSGSGLGSTTGSGSGLR